MRSYVVQSLARSDPDRAQEVAESMDSPTGRSWVLVDVADALPPEERDRKLALLTRAERHAREAQSQAQYAEANVAERWYELGEKEKAKALATESTRLKNQSPTHGFLAARLARFDLPAALAILQKHSGVDGNSATRFYWMIAKRLAAENPAEAERLLRMVPQTPGQLWLSPSIIAKMAATDPARAWRLVEEAQRSYDHPQNYLFLALGLKPRDPAAAEQAFWKAIEGIDRLMKEGVEYAAMRGTRGVLLRLVEQIAPILVPELFWRAIATRPPISNPRTTFHETPTNLVTLLAWYDREVAAALFEPVRTQIEQNDDRTLANSGGPFVSWSIFDPRAAAARLEQVPVAVLLETANSARELVAEVLGLSYEDRWRRIWSEYTEMTGLLDRDRQ